MRQDSKGNIFLILNLRHAVIMKSFWLTSLWRDALTAPTSGATLFEDAFLC